MKLSIIIVNYNTKDLTKSCLKSLEKYPLDDKFEVILVDNASQDGSREIFNKFKTNKFDFKYIYKKDNLGFSKANNIGLKLSKGKYKLLLNSDTEVKKDSLNQLVSFAENSGISDLGAVVPKLLNSDGSTQESIFRFPSIYLNILQWWFGKKGILEKYSPKTEKPLNVDIAVMAAFLLTPKVLEKVGFLDERYFMFYEDFEYCRKIAKNDLKVYYLPDVEIYHHHGLSGKNLTSDDKQWYRLLDGSRIYHGFVRHNIILFIQKSADIIQRRILVKKS